MPYKLKYLPSSDTDMALAEEYLFEHSPPAADKFTSAFTQKTADLADNPFLYPVYEPRPYYRRMPLPYKHLCFYHVDEDSRTVEIHRVLREMRDIPNLL